MLDKNSYSVFNGRYIKNGENEYAIFTNPAEYVLTHPDNFNQAPVYNLFKPEEIILAQLQNLFHTLLQTFINGDFYFINKDNEEYIYSSSLQLNKIASLVELAEKYKINCFGSLKLYINENLKKQLISKIDAAKIIAQFYKEISFNKAEEKCHQVNIPAGAISAYSINDYKEEELKSAMTGLAECVDSIKQYLHGFFIHGSMATLDYMFKASDCDTLMILDSEAAASADSLLEISGKVAKLRQIFLKIDPLQHHGVYAYTQQDMNYFPQTWLPLVLMDYSKLVFADTNEFVYKLRPSIIERRTEFWNITCGMRHQWIVDDYPRNISDYKKHLQVVLLMPVFYYQLQGAFVYKKYIFELLRREVPVNLYSIIAQATKLRMDNLYLQNGNLEDIGTSGVPEWLKRETYPDMLMRSAELMDYLFDLSKNKVLSPGGIWEDELLHLPVCAGRKGDMWAKYIYENYIEGKNYMNETPGNAVNFYDIECTLHDYPVYYERSFYDTVKDNYLSKLIEAGGIKSVYQMGTVSTPGLSDIDFIVVVDDNFRQENLNKCISAFYNLTDEERYVIKHPPSAFISEELLKKVSWLHPTFKLDHLYGDSTVIDLEQAGPVNQLINLADLFLMEFPIEFLDEVQAKKISVRNHLMRMKSLNLSARILEMNNIKLPTSVSDFISRAQSAFSSWFTNDEKLNYDNLNYLVHEGENVLYEIAGAISGRMKDLGLTVNHQNRVAGIFAGRIFFIDDWSIETAKYISKMLLMRHGYTCSVLPSEFLYGIIRYSKVKGPLGERIKRFFWIDESASIKSCRQLEERVTALSGHYELIKAQALNGGLFYPYHFCSEYWNADTITYGWLSEIDALIKDEAEFSENFAVRSIESWKDNISYPVEIQKDQDEIVTISFCRGFYRFENGFRWMAQKGLFYLASKFPVEISFKLSNLDIKYYKTYPLEAEIYINGMLTARSVFIDSRQENEHTLLLEEKRNIHEIEIVLSSSFTPREVGLNEDMRELSVFMKDLSVTVIDDEEYDSSVITSETEFEMQTINEKTSEENMLPDNVDGELVSNLDALNQAEEYIENGNLHEAKKILSSILINEPENTDALNDLAVVSIMEEKLEDALMLIDVILDIDPNNEIARDNFNILMQGKLADQAPDEEPKPTPPTPQPMPRPTTRNFLNYEPGHYYSPIPDMDYIVDNSNRIFDFKRRSTKGVNLNDKEQLLMLEIISEYEKEIPFTDEQNDKLRFYYKNEFYAYGDAVVNFAMMRHFKPKRIIEVGSGFSSACMLDTSDNFLHERVQFTFIEPYADRLKSLLKVEDKHKYRIIEAPVQSIDPSEFEVLAENDILFIDSSHVVKTGSDVEYIFTEILPVLNPGVIIHFHDIHYPFEYPKDWVYEGRAWNEMYFLKAFLQYNDTFSIVYFNAYMKTVYEKLVREKTPVFSKNCGGGIWLRRIK